jgi:formylglycine-generating enzyme required for sulfatase activity
MTLKLAGVISLSAAMALVHGLAPHAQSLRATVPASMVRLEGGTFTMGTDAADVDDLMARLGTKRREFFTTEMPAHQMSLQPFLMDRTEVTNAEFNRGRPRTHAADDSDLPATHVTWDEASSYCQSLGKRLPSEAEWEFAAGSGGRAQFPWGEEMPRPSTANWLGAGIGKPTRVASYPPNAAGLYDMAGNVWEFVADPWTDSYSGSAAPSGDRRVIRGGSFGGSPINLRVRFRDSHPSNGAAPHVGFRCARSE